MLKNVYLGSDSQGYMLKKDLIEFITSNFPDLHVVDLGVFRIEEQIEIPVLAQEVGEKVIQNNPAVGIVIDSEGEDLCNFSKDIDGLHPVLCKNLSQTEFDKSTRKNILCIAASCTSFDSASKIVKEFILNRL